FCVWAQGRGSILDGLLQPRRQGIRLMGDTYFRKVTYHLHCQDQQALAERLRQLAHQARAQQACICFDVLREQHSPEHWVIYEGWRSQESCDAFHDSAAARELDRKSTR